MKLGLRLPQRLGVDLQHDLVEAARTAEAAGYASLWTYERLLFPVTPAERYAGTNAPWPEHSRQAADPLAVLTVAAVATEKVRLGTSVLVAALHTPVQLVMAVATVDQISGGRVIAGMSTGWSTDECRAWGLGRSDPAARLPASSDLPTLILSGSFDSSTAPAWVDDIIEGFPNSVVLHFPGIGHGVIPPSACAQSIMTAFLDNPGPDVDRSCIANIKLPTLAPS